METCPACGGNGKVLCDKCIGRQIIDGAPCPKCEDGRMACDVCKGRGGA